MLLLSPNTVDQLPSYSGVPTQSFEITSCQSKSPRAWPYDAHELVPICTRNWAYVTFLVFSIISSFLVAAGVSMIPFWLSQWPCQSGRVDNCQGLPPTSIRHWAVLVLESEGDLPRSLPLRPMFEEGIGILKTDAVVLGESVTIWQVLGEYEVVLVFLQLSPWDPSLAASRHNCHGRIGSLIFILSYLKTRDPGRILPYVEERHVRILIG